MPSFWSVGDMRIGCAALIAPVTFGMVIATNQPTNQPTNQLGCLPLTASHSSRRGPLRPRNNPAATALPLAGCALDIQERGRRCRSETDHAAVLRCPGASIGRLGSQRLEGFSDAR